MFFLCSCQKQEGNIQDGGKTEKLKVAFVYVGPIGDGGWSYTHDKGRQAMEKELPFVETTYIENVPENADAERVFTELCEKGYKLIFGTTHYMGVMQRVAAKYPDVYSKLLYDLKKYSINSKNEQQVSYGLWQ
jgi:basic membrane protein A